tara:strand:- start:5932 stop:6810 length:879 start_codon:yes stop_codon:yes gene_type:complete
MTIVELISDMDSITFAADPVTADGWVYDNVTLNAWYRLPETDPRLAKRPNAHGAYGLGQVFTREHRPVLVGQFYGTTPTLALVARQRLSSMFADGQAIRMRVTDELGTTERTVWLLDLVAPFQYGFDHFPFDISLVAPDPRRYGSETSDGTGMPTAGSGLTWPLGSAVSGLFWDWGTEGTIGQVSFANGGVAPTLPRIEIGDAGGFANGFRVTEVETGREIVFERDTSIGDIVVLDSRTQRATIGAGDVSAFLSKRQWFLIPPGATRRYQVNPLGGTSGTPTMTLYAASAYL